MRAAMWLKSIAPAVAVCGLLAGSAFVVSEGVAEERKRPGHLYDTPFGTVYCARAVQRACGVELSVCHDGHVYSCVMNVRQREAEPAK